MYPIPMPRPRHIPIAAVVATALALASCAGPAGGEPALPAGLEHATVPRGTVNAYVYVRPAAPFALDDDPSRDLESLEVAAKDVGDFQWRPTYVGTSPNVPWGPGATDQVRDGFPGFWDDLQLAPSHPPSPPIAAGFVRNVGELLDALIEAGGVEVPHLSNALSLVRVAEITFVAYAEEVTSLPTHAGPAVLRELDASILAIAASSYPPAVVGQVFEGFAGALGLTPIDIAERTAYARTLTPEIDLVVLRDGATLFFAVAPTRGHTEALIASIFATTP